MVKDLVPPQFFDKGEDPVSGLVGHLSKGISELARNIGDNSQRARGVLREITGFNVERIELWLGHVLKEQTGLATNEGSFHESEAMKGHSVEEVKRSQEVFLQEALFNLFGEKQGKKSWQFPAIGLKLKRDKKTQTINDFEIELIKREHPITARFVQMDKDLKPIGFVDIVISKVVKSSGKVVENPWSLIPIQQLLDGVPFDSTSYEGIKVLELRPITEWYKEEIGTDGYGDYARPDIIIGRGRVGRRLGDLTRDRRSIVSAELGEVDLGQYTSTVTLRPPTHLPIDGAHVTDAMQYAQNSERYQSNIITLKPDEKNLILQSTGEFDGYTLPFWSETHEALAEFVHDDTLQVETLLAENAVEYGEMLEWAKMTNIQQVILSSEITTDLVQAQLDLQKLFKEKSGRNFNNIILMCIVEYLVTRQAPGYPIKPKIDPNNPRSVHQGDERLAMTGIGINTTRILDKLMAIMYADNGLSLDNFISSVNQIELLLSKLDPKLNSDQVDSILEQEYFVMRGSDEINPFRGRVRELWEQYLDRVAWMGKVRRKMTMGMNVNYFDISDLDLLERAKYQVHDLNGEPDLYDVMLYSDFVNESFRNMRAVYEHENGQNAYNSVDLFVEKLRKELLEHKQMLELDDASLNREIEEIWNFEGSDSLSQANVENKLTLLEHKIIILAFEAYEKHGLREQVKLLKQDFWNQSGSHRGVFEELVAQVGDLGHVIEAMVSDPSQAANSISTYLGALDKLQNMDMVKESAGKLLAAIIPELQVTSQAGVHSFHTALSHDAGIGVAQTLNKPVDGRAQQANLLSTKQSAFKPRIALELLLPAVRGKKDWRRGMLEKAERTIKEELASSRVARANEALFGTKAKELAQLKEILEGKDYMTMMDERSDANIVDHVRMRAEKRVMCEAYEIRKAMAAKNTYLRQELNNEALLFMKYWNIYAKENMGKTDIKNFVRKGFSNIWISRMKEEHESWKSRLADFYYVMFGIDDPTNVMANYQRGVIQSREAATLGNAYAKLREEYQQI